jgi:hypothetical protein
MILPQMEEVKWNPTRQRQCQGITVTIGAIIIGITIGSQCCTSPSHAGCCLSLTKNVTDSWAHKVFSLLMQEHVEQLITLKA